ncbi:ABC transporter ATP-binding protein [Parapusillimonas granuli]|uniref:ABC transporter ATP-binding protein n=1 Tax=Parapusillimonas granuli TaxID=380911 RepID=A0A853FRA9_9BURK|nr:ABC transporter ATP-binding protein [Parapusillimonas granuli]MBB5213536.1 iron(III) transport system ATP-binding protein [Parapusillimonas granuli]MEB2398629.1 ABC transporter ATP-binding protein [Alcaligenaceae bacterium]NYT48374.1 ABC transporter ATP-binding protein [Parapusillimonas granuli]
MAEISIEGVSKRYGDVTIIDRLDLKVRHGEFFTLLGPSGCGKTTLLRMIAGFIVPDEGRLFLDKQDITRLPAHKRETGMVFQDYALFPDKTVYDNVAYGLRVRKLSSQEIDRKVGGILARVELGHLAKRYPGELSGGQRQRVALARALVIEPRVLLMDEPLSNLDAKLRIQMRDVIRQLQQEANITAIFVTHDQEEALSMSDRIALLRSGRIDQLDTPEGLYGSPVTAYAADFIGAANLIDVQGQQADGGRTVVAIAGGRVAIPGAPRGDACQLAARPEHIGVHTDAADARVPAQVVHRRYLGFKATYALRLADGKIINADLPAASDPIHSPGSPVFLSFSPDCRLVRA